ncbi:MAG: alpha-galactosidase [Bacteroidales bacterium]
MRYLCLLLIMLFTCCSLLANSSDYVRIETNNTVMILNAQKGKIPLFVHYGNLVTAMDIDNSMTGLMTEAFPVFGMSALNEPVLQVVHADGNPSLKMVVEEVTQTVGNEVRLTQILLKDEVYPFYTRLCFKAYPRYDVIEMWTEIFHKEKKTVALQKYASAYIPVDPGNHWLSHLQGYMMNETNLVEEPLLSGSKMIHSRDGIRTSQCSNPSFMVSLDQKPSETGGSVIAGSLAWSGNYKMLFNKSYTHQLNISAGMNEEGAEYRLAPMEQFRTPQLVLTFSTRGKGGASRNLHRWARENKLIKGTALKDILLNSWEGVYFNIKQGVMNEMMQEFSSIGGEMFVMDDGWFGNKYPRNNDKTSLGDWTVCREKLPDGIEGLIDCAQQNNLRFGIWIEPEMTNLQSELYEEKPHWVLHHPNRTPGVGRGGSQLVLDMTNPEVRDYVYDIVDRLLTDYPQIAYIKWDTNMSLQDYGSSYLPANKQSHLYIEYHRGLTKVFERIRSKYPDVIMQACAGGGGRVNYAYMPYFNEFWTSDNTDAVQRLYTQWGFQCFYPANTMAAHVSASPNHQSGRIVPLKFRFDVAMTGRLGMEMDPGKLSKGEKEAAKAAIEAYKSVRELVQLGDLYRLISPYENRRTASLMYVDSLKNRAVFFAYQIDAFVQQAPVRYKMDGLDPLKKYRLTEINKKLQGKSRFVQDGKAISGRFLMTEGLYLPLKREYDSMVIEITEIKE